MSGMRILTVRQPWAWAIIHGGKDVENRVRNIAGDYRGPVAIHAALWKPPTWREAIDLVINVQTRTDAALPDATDPLHGYVRGAILGVIDLVDVHFGPFAERWDVEVERNARCTPWAEPDMFHLVLANPRPLPEPIPFKGALGLRRLPDDVADEVREGIAS